MALDTSGNSMLSTEDNRIHSINTTMTTGPNRLLVLIFSIPIAVVTPFIIVGNMLVIAAVYQNHRLRTPTNIILTSLAIADLLSGTFGNPLRTYILNDIHTCTSKLNLASIPITVLGSASFLNVVILTLDRYLAVTRPLRYAGLVTINRVAYFLTFVWLFLGVFFATYTMIVDCSDTCLGESLVGQSVSPLYWLLLVLSTLTAFTIIICNVLILRIALKQYRSIAVQHGAVRHHPEEQEGLSRLKAVKTISIIVGLFCLAWVPFLIDLFVRLTTTYSTYSDVVWITGMSYMIFSFKSALDPVVYGYREREFRQALLRILRSVWASVTCTPP